MMPNPLRSLLERFAQRIVAASTRLFATTFDTLRLECEVEQERRLEELARQYESDGMPELAASVRERAKRLTVGNATADGESLLEQFSEPTVPLIDDATGQAVPRRIERSKPAAVRKSRKKKAVSAPASPKPEDNPPAPADTFFSIDGNSPCSSEGDAQ